MKTIDNSNNGSIFCTNCTSLETSVFYQCNKFHKVLRDMYDPYENKDYAVKCLDCTTRGVKCYPSINKVKTDTGLRM